MHVETENLDVSVPKKRIVECANIHVDDEEFVGLLGPNGAGKSTLLKCVYRVMKPENGNVFFDDIPLHEMSLRDSAQKMSVVTQHNYYNFDFKVEEVVMMGRTPHKKMMELDNDEDRMIVEDCLRKVNMLEFKDRGFSSLSGGEQQRIILARALAQKTPCLVLDEPTNHLDIKYQLEVLDIVKSLKCTTLCALHDLNLAAQYCDRIYIMKDGKIAAEGKPEEIINEEIIETIYGVKSTVSIHPETGKPNIVYYTERMKNSHDF